MFKKNFRLPNDVWLVDLDSNKIIKPPAAEDPPSLPEPEEGILASHLRQALQSMSTSPQLMKNTENISPEGYSSPSIVSGISGLETKPSLSPNTPSSPYQSHSSPHLMPSMPTSMAHQKSSHTHQSQQSQRLIYGNDVDSVDIATRVAMVRFFNSPSLLANFTEHTRTIKLYPRPVVAFQINSFLQSRPKPSVFLSKFVQTQVSFLKFIIKQGFSQLTCQKNIQKSSKNYILILRKFPLEFLKNGSFPNGCMWYLSQEESLKTEKL